MQRTCATKWHQDKFSRVVAALDGNGSNRPDHIGDYDAEKTVSSTFETEPEPIGYGLEGFSTQFDIETHFSIE